MNHAINTSWVDRAIGYFAPVWGHKRAVARAAIAEMRNLYDADRPGRLDTYWSTSRAERGFNSALNTWRLTRLRDRARHLVQNNVLAAGMLDRAVENTIGHGMRLQAQTQDHGFNAAAEELWTDWLDTADIRGMFSGAQLQQLVYRHHLLDGDVGCGLVARGADCYLQGYEGDLITTLNGGNRPGENVIDGIEHDDDNRPTAFYVTPFNDFGMQTAEQRIRARDFVFLARMRRLSQVRGEPCFAQSFKLFDQIGGLNEAVIVAARIAACQGLIIKKSGGSQIVNGLRQGLSGERLTRMEPGAVSYIEPDEDVQTVNPSQPTQNFGDFISIMLRFAGLGLGLPLELVLLDFSRTNYSSARASLLQAYRTFRTQQQFFCDRFMSRVYRWRISRAVKTGQLVVPAKLLADPSSGRAASYWDHAWTAPGWAWIDPVKEIQAAQMAIDAGLDTITGVLQQHGKSIEDVTATRHRELALLKRLMIDVSKSNMTRDATITPGGTPPTDPAKGNSGNGSKPEKDPADPDADDPDRADDPDPAQE